MAQLTHVPVDDIAVLPGYQVRPILSLGKVAEYAAMILAGSPPPPVTVYKLDGQLVLTHGFRRLAAAKKAGLTEIPATVHSHDTKQGALWSAILDNGDTLNMIEKRHACALAVQMWPDISPSLLGNRLGLSAGTVRDVKNEILGVLASHVITTSRGATLITDKGARAAAMIEAEQMLRDGFSFKDTKEKTKLGRPVIQELVNKIKAEAAVFPPARTREEKKKRNERIYEMARKGYSSGQIAVEMHMTQDAVAKLMKDAKIEDRANKVSRGARQVDPNRVLEQIVIDAENLVADLGLIDFANVDPDRLPGWMASLVASHKQLGSFIRRIQESS